MGEASFEGLNLPPVEPWPEPEKCRAGKLRQRESIADSAFAWLRRDKCGLQIEGEVRRSEPDEQAERRQNEQSERWSVS